MSFNVPGLEGATPAELAQIAAEALAKLKPGMQPPALFKEMARLTMLSIVEVVPLRVTSGKTEILIAERAQTEEWWPNTRSLPGSVQFPPGRTDYTTNSDYREPVDGVLYDDFGRSVERTDENVQIFDVRQRTGVRGSEQVVLAWTKVDTTTPFAKPIGGEFFDASALIARPDDFQLVDGHAEEIAKALANFRQY
ncbi:MAG: hypothetical protein JWN26_174 [Candidatus Saccharibacteria bacterium]|nr:hypothetical protein [Candidatus Saccharibacteria bacterium]